MTDDWPSAPPARPLWLLTLADLALLLVGFFVLVQASRTDPHALAQSLRSGFVKVAPPAEPTLSVAANRLGGFAAGSATLPADTDAILGWAQQELRDPRVTVTVTGSADAAAGDVDRATGSAAVLATDRARAVAIRLAPAAPRRIAIATATGPAAVTLSLAFTGSDADTHRTRP
jgi:hypothetical protein